MKPSYTFILMLASFFTLEACTQAHPPSTQLPNAQPPISQPCEVSNELSYICGPIAAEDIVQLPNSPWLIASGLNIGESAHLYLIDTRTNEASYLSPNSENRFDAIIPGPESCPFPPNPLQFSFTGLSLQHREDNTLYILAVNHGDRHAIEVFRVFSGESRPRIEWQKCLPLPEGTLPNAVAGLSNGDTLVTSFYNPDDADNEWQRMARGEGTGKLLLWQNEHFIELPVGIISGANGLAISEDETTAYISAWSEQKLIVYTLNDHLRKDITLDFLPDNITVKQEGILLVAGQQTSVQNIADCTGPECPQPWIIAEVDTKTNTVTAIVEQQGDALINYATAAIEINNTLYITGRGDRRIALFDRTAE